MKKVFGQKSKIFLIIFLSSILILNLARSQDNYCSSAQAISFGELESPKFCFNSQANITKFTWRGFLEPESGISFTLKGYSDSISDTPQQTISFSVQPGIIYTNEGGQYLLEKVQCLKYKVELYKCEEDSIPRVDKIFIYYSF